MIKNHTFNLYSFPAAREAFAKVISIAGTGKKILLPGFIGFSVREGSGIFDPVRNSGIDYEFYKMDGVLHIQLDSLKESISRNPGSILLIVHYWGFVDPAYNEIKEFAREKKCIIVEDFAHGLFTFFKTPTVDFDYGFFSLHKMFAYDAGGVLIAGSEIESLNTYDLAFFRYNLQEISRIRLANYSHLLEKLKAIHPNKITLLRDNIGRSVPQTFPILLSDNHLKDYLYFKMNEAGFGVVSLYHQLIAEVDNTFIHEHNISSRILNLPIHQDVLLNDLDDMVKFLDLACTEYESRL